MNTRLGKINADNIADLAVLVVLTLLVITYGVDSVRASTHVLNLIFVLPLTIIVLGLCLVQFVRQVPKLTSADEETQPATGVFTVVVLFAAYVLSLNWLGFDVGTFFFLCAFLWLHGERRWPWLFGYSLSFALSMSLFFSTMLPYPMPMLLLGTAY